MSCWTYAFGVGGYFLTFVALLTRPHKPFLFVKKIIGCFKRFFDFIILKYSENIPFDNVDSNQAHHRNCFFTSTLQKSQDLPQLCS